MTTTILGVNLENRLETALEFQRIITEYGCNIKMRLGLHPSKDGVCLNRGIVLLEVGGDGQELMAELCKHWEIQTMTFE